MRTMPRHTAKSSAPRSSEPRWTTSACFFLSSVSREGSMEGALAPVPQGASTLDLGTSGARKIRVL